MSTLQFEKKNALDYLPKFKDVELVASLDHYGEKAELIRYGTVWQEILDNLTYIKELKQPNIRVVTNTVVTTLNVLDMPDILRMFRTMHLEGLLTPQTLYRAVDPWYLDCRNVDKEVRQRIIQEIEQVQQEYVEPELQNYRTLFIEDVKNFLLTDSPHDLNKVKEHTITQMASFDQRRGTNWRKTLTGLWNLVK